MDLTGPKARLDWAYEHLKTLSDELGRFSEAKPFQIADEFDHERRCHVMRLRLRFRETNSIRLSLIVGDLIHNARSALDQAAWLVACRSNPVEKLWEPRVARRISFPVTDDPRKFCGHSVMPYIADDAKTVFKRLQPYEGGDTAEALGRLDALWNIDKHRVLHSGLMRFDLSGVTLRPNAVRFEDFPTTITWHPMPERAEDGTKIATVCFRGGNEPPLTNVEVKGKAAFDVAFGSGDLALGEGPLKGLVGHTGIALAAIGELPDTPP